jgi:hypothetical protein
MTTKAITTLIKMMEAMPENAQYQVVEHLRDYIENMRDEMHWDTLFKKTETQLIAAARRARNEIARGHAKPMDFKKL